MSNFKLKIIKENEIKSPNVIMLSQGDKNPKLTNTKFFVEANSFEQLQLWKEYNKKIKWEEDNCNISQLVGYINEDYEKPVYISFSFSKIIDSQICFYYATSRFVDYQMIEDYIKNNFPVRYDNDSRWAMTDAMNFHHCVSACKIEFLKKDNLYNDARQQ